MSFGKDLARIGDKSKDKLFRAARKIALDAFSEVILLSPVDRGRFRGNWQVAIGTIPVGTIEIDDRTGTVTIAKVQAEVLGLELGDVIYLVNNLPYGPELEEGSSKQAPAGMVRLTQQRFQPIADAVIRQIGRE